MKSNKIVKDFTKDYTKKKITNIEELKIFTMQIGMFYNVYNVELINMFSKKFNRSFVSRWQEVERRGEERRDGQFDRADGRSRCPRARGRQLLQILTRRHNLTLDRRVYLDKSVQKRARCNFYQSPNPIIQSFPRPISIFVFSNNLFFFFNNS